MFGTARSDGLHRIDKTARQIFRHESSVRPSRNRYPPQIGRKKDRCATSGCLGRAGKWLRNGRNNLGAVRGCSECKLCLRIGDSLTRNGEAAPVGFSRRAQNPRLPVGGDSAYIALYSCGSIMTLIAWPLRSRSIPSWTRFSGSRWLTIRSRGRIPLSITVAVRSKLCRPMKAP